MTSKILEELAFCCENSLDLPPEHIRTILRATKTMGKYPN